MKDGWRVDRTLPEEAVNIVRAVAVGCVVALFGQASCCAGGAGGGTDSLAETSSPNVNPRLATALSILVPGLGNVYAGEPVRGLVHFAAFTGSIGLTLSAHIGESHDSVKPFGWFAVGTVAASYLWGVIDCALLEERVRVEPALSEAALFPPPDRRGRSAVWQLSVRLRL